MTPIIDLHQDLVFHMETRENEPEQTSYLQLEKSSVCLTIVTGFIYPDDAGENLSPYMIDLDQYNKHVMSFSDWRMVCSGAGISELLEEGGNGLLYGIEGIYGFQPHHFATLERMHRNGLRSIGLVWNDSNSLGGGASDQDTGLTSLGAELIAWCEKHNVIVDCAHMSRKTFADVSRIRQGPMFVSHSGAAKVHPRDRNLTDEELRVIQRTGGVVGIYFAPGLLGGKSIDKLFEHVRHIVNLIGVEHVAIGSDFGGILGEPIPGLSSVSCFKSLEDEFRRRGFADTDIVSIFSGNAQRVLTEMLG